MQGRLREQSLRDKWVKEYSYKLNMFKLADLDEIQPTVLE